jgi:hypothetical protein
MFYFQLYGAEGALVAFLFGGGMILAAVATWWSILHYRKPTDENGRPDEHANPGVPLVLKAMYLGLLIWGIAVTYLVATMGTRI